MQMAIRKLCDGRKRAELLISAGQLTNFHGPHIKRRTGCKEKGEQLRGRRVKLGREDLGELQSSS